MLKRNLPQVFRRLLTTSNNMSRKVDLVCPICFDLGFTKTAMRGVISDDTTRTVENKVFSPRPNQPEKKSNETIAESSSEKVIAAPRGDGEEPAAVGTRNSPSTSPFALSETMKHKYEKRIEQIFTLPTDVGTVEPEVNSLLNGEESRSEEWHWAFAKAELINNQMIPFKYWLEQPCPARRDEENQTSPCVTIRRGLHDYLLETNPEYAAKQDLMLKLGYVSPGGGGASQGIQVGHLEVGTIPASGWAVEGFIRDDIPSPWRKPWHPDQGLVICERPVTSGDTASDEAFQKATDWFRECNAAHPGCSLGEISSLPVRVLDIAADDTTSGVRLLRTDGRKGRYACLSHRWGSETPTMTTENVDSFCTEIPWHVLSPTYQDAVTFLRRFSKWHQEEYGEAIRYIWIDSLCITQDSTTDWTEHSLGMSDIYSNSSITLVESHHIDGEKRLFHKSSTTRVPKSVSVQDALGKTHEFYYRHAIHHPDFMVNNEVVPIWTRAWVFQERLLSRRLLIFGSDELSWQCSGHNKCECGLDELEAQSRTLMTEWDHNLRVRLPSVSSRKNLNLILGESPSYRQLRMAWRLVIESYSKLQFTYRKDTMYAIAGLAKSFNARLGGKKYFAGIWYDETEGEELEDSEETALDLLWRLAYKEDAKREDLPEPAVPISWSWTYPECSVVYPFVHDEVLSYYSLVASISGAMNVERLPDDHQAPRHWLDDMYKEVPPSAIIACGPIWKTQLLTSQISFKVKDTEDQEYFYFLGAMSASVYQEVAFGRPVQGTRILIQPPSEEGESIEATLQKMPPIVFYPDNLLTDISGPLFCFPIAKFKHLPVKSGLEEKVIFAALILEAVGHMATTEGFDPDLSSKEPEDLIFRRLGLAYTTDGGWEEEHDEMLGKLTVAPIRIV